MIIGTHTVIASKDPASDLKFLTEDLGLTSVDAGGGYTIVGLPQSEMSVHSTEGDVPHHETYFLVADVAEFNRTLDEKGIGHSSVEDTGWGELITLTLPSGAPLKVYQPRHERP